MESSFECEVCMIAYNSNEHRPRFLPCGHSMCSSCINETLRTCSGKLACPFCRTQCGTGVKTLDDFPTAFALLNLLGKTEPKTSPDALSPIDKEYKVYLEKKQVEYDYSGTHIIDCTEHLDKVFQAKKLQEVIIENIEIEQKKLEEEKKKAISRKDQLDGITFVGHDILKKLEALQECVKCSTDLSSLKEATKDGNKYYITSEEWIASTASIVIEEDTGVSKETDDSDNVPCSPQETTMNTSARCAPTGGFRTIALAPRMRIRFRGGFRDQNLNRVQNGDLGQDRDQERGWGWSLIRDRNQDRDSGTNRDQGQDRGRGHDRGRNRGGSFNRDRFLNRCYGWNRERDQQLGQDRDQDRGWGINRDQDHDQDSDQDRNQDIWNWS